MAIAQGSDMPGFGDLEKLPVIDVPVESLLNSDSPRSSGEDREHIKALAESGDQLPPLVVHRPTMRVIDGMHRLLAARLNGKKTIPVRFFDGDEAISFVLAVRANVMHGLPLSLADRKAAAARIISYYPQWSDRGIASASGLSPRTVATIRDRPSEQDRQMDVRIGRDGRARPVDISQKREQVIRLVASQPNASLREIARQAGISPETVRRIRDGLAGGKRKSQPSCGEKTKNRYQGPPRPPLTEKVNDLDVTLALRFLHSDPALRSTEHGRALLRMLAASRIVGQQGETILETVPAHCMPRIAEASRACALAWMRFAELTERRSKGLAILFATGCEGIP